MTETVDKPIVVNSSSMPDIIATGIRYIATLIGGLMVSKNILPADTDVNQIAGVILVLVSTIYGIFKTQRNHAKQVTMAAVLPDSVAQVR